MNEEIMNQGNGFELELTRFTNRFGHGVMKRQTESQNLTLVPGAGYWDGKVREVVKNVKI